MAEGAIRNGIEVIVTRNKKDFKGLAVKVCSPGEFVKLFEK